MAKADIKKCAYTHCKHDNKEIDIKNDAYELEKGRYYHPDCKHEKDTIAEIIDFWYRNIDEHVIFNQLVKILNRIIYKENVDPDYILYALKKKYKYLNHPPGLIYAIRDKSVMKDWEFEKKLKAFNETKDSVKIEDNEGSSFVYKESSGKKSFGDIFGGK